MSFWSPLRAAGVSAVALAVASTTGVVLALAPATDVVATPASQEQAEAQADALAQREALVVSRDAERRADALELVAATNARADALASTSEAIGATEQAIAEEIAAAARAAEEEKQRAAEFAKAAAVGAERANRGVLVSVPGDNPKANKETARRLAQEIYGWGDDQFSCYDNIIMRESMWITNADNPTSSAYGIPQALPGKKMATMGDDWAINPETQIKWGLKYVKDRFGTPCKAWSFKRANGWY